MLALCPATRAVDLQDNSNSLFRKRLTSMRVTNRMIHTIVKSLMILTSTRLINNMCWRSSPRRPSRSTANGLVKINNARHQHNILWCTRALTQIHSKSPQIGVKKGLSRTNNTSQMPRSFHLSLAVINSQQGPVRQLNWLMRTKVRAPTWQASLAAF